MKYINTYISEKLKISNKTYTLFPKNKDELVKMIKQEIKQNGYECSLNHIDVSKITDMEELFAPEKYHGYNLHEFNGDISQWDVSNVKYMNYMFYASEFNRDISGWDVSNVTNMTGMFKQSNFDGDISDWDVSNVNFMTIMFSRSQFNSDIADWDVSNVTDMYCMFYSSSFNQDISNWKLSLGCNTDGMFTGCHIKNNYRPKSLQK
jgi:surface protein